MMIYCRLISGQREKRVFFFFFLFSSFPLKERKKEKLITSNDHDEADNNDEQRQSIVKSNSLSTRFEDSVSRKDIRSLVNESQYWLWNASMFKLPIARSSQRENLHVQIEIVFEHSSMWNTNKTQGKILFTRLRETNWSSQLVVQSLASLSSCLESVLENQLVEDNFCTNIIHSSVRHEQLCIDKRMSSDSMNR